MATITTRSGKGSPLTNNEVDANFTNLNTDKAELSGATFTGAITANAGVVVDTMTIDGSAIASTGSLGLDIGGNLTIDVDGTAITLADGGANWGQMFNSAQNFVFKNPTGDKDILFQGIDGSSTITALHLDMSDGGSARFAHDISLVDSGQILLGVGLDGRISSDGTNLNILANNGNLTLDVAGNIFLDADGGDVALKDGGTEFGRLKKGGNNLEIQSRIYDGDIVLKGFDNTTIITALTLDMSLGGTAVFNDNVGIGQSPTAFSNWRVLEIKGGSAGAMLNFEDNSSARVAALAYDGGSSQLRMQTMINAPIKFEPNNAVALTLDGSQNATFNGTVETGGTLYIPQWIEHSGDSNTYFGFPSGDQFKIVTGNTGRLHITGSESVWNEGGEDKNFRVESNGNANMLFVDGGNNHVGIGTATLNRSGLGTDHICLTVGADNQMGMLELQATRTSNADLGRVSFLNAGTRRAEIVAARIDADNSTKLYFQTSNAGSLGTRLTIGKDGAATFNSSVNVNADFKVHPNNTTRGLNITSTTTGTAGDTTIYDTIAAGFGRHVFKTDGTERFKIAQDGSLSTPTAGTSNVRFGVNAGNSIVSGGNYNVVVGDEAGTAITTASFNTALGTFSFRANTTGHSNTALGYSTLELNTTGIRNVAVGMQSLEANTTGSYNVAVGNSSLFVNTTASNNTAVGYASLTANTSGGSNVAMGYNAGAANTTGTNLVAVGANALDANTTGINNIGIGRNAAGGTTSGTGNVAIGTNSLLQNTTGQSNVSVGTYALNANTTASNNTAVGYQALTDNTTGGDNTALGFTALDANTTGASNVSLGSYSLSANTTGGTNVAVGDAALLSNTTASNNVAVGKDSLRANTTATENTAVGAKSLLNTTTGSYNTAFGYRSGEDITTGTQNVAIGRNVMANSAGVTGSENVGVGGAVLYDLTSGNYNTAIGQEALRRNTTASNNTAVGYLSLTANTTGGNNVAVGALALDANTTGANNTAVGLNALTTNTTGASNVALGAYALNGNTTASNNTAIGRSAISSNTIGTSLVAIGTNALYSNTTAANNIAIGHESLFYNTTGSENTAVGRSALVSNVSGSNNTAIAYGALNDNTTGAQNIAVGRSALGSNTTASNNTAIGYNAGAAVTTGVKNTLIGGLAGDSIQTGSNNVIIGNDSDVSAEGDNNSIVLGQNVTCVGSGNFTFGFSTTDSNIAAGATTITAPSDERYKEEIADATAGLSFINDLRPVTFKWKKEKDIPTTQKAYVEGSETRVMNDYTNHGFIAQEVKTVIDAHPEIKDGFDMWQEDNADGRQRLGPSALVPMLVKAIQEQQTLIEALTARIETLEG